MTIVTVKNFLRLWKITRCILSCENVYKRRQFTSSFNNSTVIERIIPLVSNNRKRRRKKLKNRVLTESNYLLPIPIHRVKKKVDYPICETRSERWEKRAKTRIGWKLRFDFASVPSFLTLVATTGRKRRTTMSKRQRLRLFLTHAKLASESFGICISLEKCYAISSYS